MRRFALVSIEAHHAWLELGSFGAIDAQLQRPVLTDEDAKTVVHEVLASIAAQHLFTVVGVLRPDPEVILVVLRGTLTAEQALQSLTTEQSTHEH